MSTGQIISRPRPVSMLGQSPPRSAAAARASLTPPPPVRSVGKTATANQPTGHHHHHLSSAPSSSSPTASRAEGRVIDSAAVNSARGLEPAAAPIQPTQAVLQPLQPSVQPLQPVKASQPAAPSVLPPMSHTPLEPQQVGVPTINTTRTSPISNNEPNPSDLASDLGDKYAALADLDMNFNDPGNGLATTTTAIDWGKSEGSEEENGTNNDTGKSSMETSSEVKDTKVRRFSQVAGERGVVNGNMDGRERRTSQVIQGDKFRRSSTGTQPMVMTATPQAGMQYQVVSPYGPSMVGTQSTPYSIQPNCSYSGFSHMSAATLQANQQYAQSNGAVHMVAAQAGFQGVAVPVQEGFTHQPGFPTGQGYGFPTGQGYGYQGQPGYAVNWSQQMNGAVQQQTTVDPAMYNHRYRVASTASLCLS